MMRASKLRPAPGPTDNVKPMKRKEPFEEVLDAFAVDNPPDDLALDEQDKLYSDAVSKGLVSEREVNSSFEQLLGRTVTRDSETGELSLAAPDVPTVGERVRAYRAQRSMTVAELAQAHQLTTEQVDQLESATELFENDRIVDIAKELATALQAPAMKLHTLLQSVRATSELKSAQGPSLMAARRPSSK
jgi:hypothetical protein